MIAYMHLQEAQNFMFRLVEFEARRVALVQREMMSYLTCLRDAMQNRYILAIPLP